MVSEWQILKSNDQRTTNRHTAHLKHQLEDKNLSVPLRRKCSMIITHEHNMYSLCPYICIYSVWTKIYFYIDYYNEVKEFTTFSKQISRKGTVYNTIKCSGCTTCIPPHHGIPPHTGGFNPPCDVNPPARTPLHAVIRFNALAQHIIMLRSQH